jgi:hypothetical protein
LSFGIIIDSLRFKHAKIKLDFFTGEIFSKRKLKSIKPLIDEALEAFESSHDFAAELRKSVKEMIAKKGAKVEVSSVVSAIIKSGQSQSQFP